jgi:hypothetical protein
MYGAVCPNRSKSELLQLKIPYPVSSNYTLYVEFPTCTFNDHDMHSFLLKLQRSVAQPNKGILNKVKASDKLALSMLPEVLGTK